MEKRPPLPMTQLDRLVTTNDLQLMKFMLPYLPANWQNMLAIYIKFTEFMNTVRIFHQGPDNCPHNPIHRKSIHSPEDILEDLGSFIDPSEAENISMIFHMMNTMKHMDPSAFSSSGATGEMAEMMDLFDNIMKGNDKNE